MGEFSTIDNGVSTSFPNELLPQTESTVVNEFSAALGFQSVSLSGAVGNTHGKKSLSEAEALHGNVLPQFHPVDLQIREFLVSLRSSRTLLKAFFYQIILWTSEKFVHRISFVKNT